MKKLMILIILLTTVISCELFDSERLDRIERENKERGRVCERDGEGYYRCYDTK